LILITREIHNGKTVPGRFWRPILDAQSLLTADAGAPNSLRKRL
jgi:hypothetical protein